MFIQLRSKKTSLQISIDYILNQSKKKVKWIKLTRWVNVFVVLASIDYLLIHKDNNLDKITKESLLVLYVKVDNMRKKFNSTHIPLKALKILIKPLLIIDKKL